MTLSDLEWLSEIFNDVNHHAVSLRQLRFLFYKAACPTWNSYSTQKLSMYYSIILASCKPGSKPGFRPGLQPVLQLARIMECGLCLSVCVYMHNFEIRRWTCRCTWASKRRNHKSDRLGLQWGKFSSTPIVNNWSSVVTSDLLLIISLVVREVTLRFVSIEHFFKSLKIT